MKKFVAFVLVMAMAAVVSASPATGLMITTEGTTMGVSCNVPGFVLTTASLVPASDDLKLDFSGFTAPAMYDYIPGVVALPWGGAPVVLDPAAGTFTAYTGSATAPMGPATIFTGVALPEGWYFVNADDAGAVAIDLVADTLNIGGQTSAGVMDTVYAAVPEPMTMTLLGLGGLVAARRRRA